MKSIPSVFLILAFTGNSLLAQLDAGNPLSGLAKLKDFETKRASSSDPNWRNGNGDCRWIKPGGTLTLGRSSKVRAKSFTSGLPIAHTDPYYSRLLTLKMYWDGETDPSVECPIGDFFGIGHGVGQALHLAAGASQFGWTRTQLLLADALSQIRHIVVVNESDKPCDAFYYYMTGKSCPPCPATRLCFTPNTGRNSRASWGAIT